MGPGPTISSALDRLWLAGETEQVESSLIKSGGITAKVVLRFQDEIAELQQQVERQNDRLKKQEIQMGRQAKELRQTRQDLAEAERVVDSQWQTEELLANMNALQDAAEKEKEKRVLLEKALNRLLQNWETSQHSLILSGASAGPPGRINE